MIFEVRYMDYMLSLWEREESNLATMFLSTLTMQYGSIFHVLSFKEKKKLFKTNIPYVNNTWIF